MHRHVTSPIDSARVRGAKAGNKQDDEHLGEETSAATSPTYNRDPSKHVRMKADVVLGHVQPALNQDLPLQRASILCETRHVSEIQMGVAHRTGDSDRDTRLQ